MISFASDNNFGAPSWVLDALSDAGRGFAPSYGDDALTEKARRSLARLFGRGAEAHFVFNGTAANVLALASFVRPHEFVIASDCSHLVKDECGAFERFAGSRVFTVPHRQGKITAAAIAPLLTRLEDQHHGVPRAISITQPTEYGTLYSDAEIRAIARLARRHRMILHMDGARFANAVAATGRSPRALTADLGVDALSFGGTKNGFLFGEAVVFFGHADEARAFPFLRKQGLNLPSKMRFVAAQFLAALENGRWIENARHANAMATRLARGLARQPRVKLVAPAQANAVFARMPRALIAKLRREFYFYVWDERESVVRLMASFETRTSDVDAFLEALARRR
jgi:threonine aldolase